MKINLIGMALSTASGRRTFDGAVLDDSGQPMTAEQSLHVLIMEYAKVAHGGESDLTVVPAEFMPVSTNDPVVNAEQRYNAALLQLAELSPARALSASTGHFAGNVLATARQHGHSTDQEIHIDGGAGRDITIHPRVQNGTLGMTAKHTPHPWKAKMLATYQQPGWIVLWPDKGGAHMRRLDYDGGFTEQDARLIAAAPELLLALQGICRKLAPFPMPGMRDEYNAAMTAIAKATGDTA